MHAGFAQFAAFGRDAFDDAGFVAAGKPTMPVLAIGGGNSFGPMMATVLRYAASDVTEAVIPESTPSVDRYDGRRSSRRRVKDRARENGALPRPCERRIAHLR